MAGVEGETQIGLLHFGRHTGAGASTLRVYNHDGDLRHRCVSDQLGHQRETWAGGGCHRPQTTEGSSDYRCQRGYLVFRLQESATDLGQFFSQCLHDIARGCNRIS